MKKIKTIFFFFGIICSYIISYKVYITQIQRLLNIIYSGWIKREFKSCGINFFVSYPIYGFGLKNIVIGHHFFSRKGLRLEAIGKFMSSKFTPILIIGNNVSINDDCHIGCINRIEIGNNVLIASKVFITDHYHGEINRESIKIPPSKRELYSKGSIIIEDNVWIGEGVVILPGTNIGRNSIIGANSVVTKSFPQNSIIGGNPARVIKVLD